MVLPLICGGPVVLWLKCGRAAQSCRYSIDPNNLFLTDEVYGTKQGNTEQHQLTLICQLCGSIVPEIWPDVEKLELFNKMELPKGQKRKVKGLSKS